MEKGLNILDRCSSRLLVNPSRYVIYDLLNSSTKSCDSGKLGYYRTWQPLPIETATSEVQQQLELRLLKLKQQAQHPCSSAAELAAETRFHNLNRHEY
ncbi:hypothetical protein C2S51_001939 [Perilla frutescens var. frutescens]|nr:hypothetical protein C2S51_001939 [Perilla frutescens var. frutescens]